MTEKYMSIWEHLEELRSRLKISGFVFLISVFVFYAITDKLISIMTQHFLGGFENVKLISSDPMMGFSTRIEFTLILALSVTIPFLIYELFLFISPALNEKHKHVFLKTALSSMVLFICGMSFMYFVLIPLMFSFFIEYNAKMGLTNFFALDSFFSFVILTIFMGGVVFQVPLVLVFANRIGLIKKSTLKHSRKWVVLITLIVSGIATPDHSIISQLALAIVLILLFEISLIFFKKEVPAPA